MIPESCDVGLKEMGRHFAGPWHQANKQSFFARRNRRSRRPGALHWNTLSSGSIRPDLHDRNRNPNRRDATRSPDPALTPGKVPTSTFAVATPIGRIEDEVMLDRFKRFTFGTTRPSGSGSFIVLRALGGLALRPIFA